MQIKVPKRMNARIVFLLVAITMLCVPQFIFEGSQSPDGITIKDKTFAVERVEDPVQQQMGLSNRSTMADDVAMLFVFTEPDVRCFWMKDMKFALDIVWLNAQKQVNAIERNLQPSSYPTSYCHVDAQYVIELNAGTVSKLNLILGEQVRF